MWGPYGVFSISSTALTAHSTLGNCASATFVGTTGANRSVAIYPVSIKNVDGFY
jgi:hypothetical protein